MGKDGKNGNLDPQNSTYVLIDWWNTHTNYQKYRCKGNNGLWKIQICARLCDKINKVSRFFRSPSSVKGEIIYIEHAWRKAHDWANETGQGVKENEDIEYYEAGVLR